MITMETILGLVTNLTEASTSMLTSYGSYWFVFLPIAFVVFRFLFKVFKSLLMYRGSRRRGN